MAYEIELKVFLKDKDTIIDALTSRGCIWKEKTRQYDKTYCNKRLTDVEPNNKDIFLRIRHEDNNNSILTLKKILNDTEVIEFESTVGNPEDISKMIQLIGFQEYVVINKIRMEGKLDEFLICIDEVEELGTFLEIEKVIEDDNKRDKTKKELQRFLLSLGIDLEQVCNKRYHTMIYDLHNKGK